MDFDTAYRIGKRKLSWFRLRGKQNLLISLDDLSSLVRPLGSHYAGVKDVLVKDILGSEDRSSDFAEGFYPVHKWMETRWNRVKELLFSDKIAEPVKLLKYGGYYFVRDGNHRVSVAKRNGIEFLTAEVTELKTPVMLMRNMMRRHIPLFEAKYRFQRDTGVFDVIPENNFFVKVPETWDRLKDSIFRGHKKWFLEKNGFEPENKALIKSWNTELYDTVMEYIKKHQLPFLVHGRLETDIFCDLMELWKDMDKAWFSDVYSLYVRKMRRRHFPRIPLYLVKQLIRRLKATRRDERRLFLQVTRLYLFRPDAKLPHGGRSWYRFLTKQVMVYHYRYLTKKLGRNPYMHELTGSWYDELFKPASDLYATYNIKESFVEYYMKWMKSWEE